MHEMLGNQYFLARNYYRSAENLEKALWKTPENKAVQRKLIVCYTKIGKIQKALESFLSLIKKDIDFILNTDPVDDDCPCPELIFDMENRQNQHSDSVDSSIVLGILWLYCDINKAIEYFKKAHSIDAKDPLIKSALSLIKARKNHSINDTVNETKEV
jgi:tetratricopeptide (TPR) repeat protein